MKRLLVHVGPRKTGSTSIQTMLWAQRRRLLERGVLVPRAGWLPFVPPAASGHRGLVMEMKRFPAGHWGDLAAEIRATRAEQIVLSAEGFTSPHRRRGSAARLRAFARRENLEPRIVGYVRPQWQLIEAEYAQRCRGGRVGSSFERFVLDVLADRGREFADYNAVFGPLRAAFGHRVLVCPLEGHRLGDGLLRHFLGLLGVDAAGFVAPVVRSNPRPGAKASEVRQRFHAAARAASGARPRLGRRRRRKLLADAVLARLLPDDTPFRGFDAAGIGAIDAAFAAANARFARAYGVDDEGVLFRAPVAIDGPRPNVVRWEDFTAEERRRVRCHVLQGAGLDLDRPPGPPHRRQVRWRRDLRALLGRVRGYW